MHTIETSELSTVTGGCLQPGAIPSSRKQVTTRCNPDTGLLPGATVGTPDSVIPFREFKLGLKPGQTK